MYEEKGEPCIGKRINARKSGGLRACQTRSTKSVGSWGYTIVIIKYNSESKTIGDDIVLEIPVLRSPKPNKYSFTQNVSLQM